MRQLIHVTLVSILVSGFALTSACNTMRGAGKDVERGGEEIQKASCTENSTDPSCKK